MKFPCLLFYQKFFLSLHFVLQKFNSCVIKERMSSDFHMKKMMLLSRESSPDVMCVDQCSLCMSLRSIESAVWSAEWLQEVCSF
jgi:hypothetical protein